MPAGPLVRTVSLESPGPDDDEVHPMYEVTRHPDALFGLSLFCGEEHELLTRWRELGAELFARGEAALARAVEAAEDVLHASGPTKPAPALAPVRVAS